MKKLEAIIRPEKVDAVKEALVKAELRGLTMTEVLGVGRQHGHREIYRGAEYAIDAILKVKLDLVVEDQHLDMAVAAICGAALTGKIGDGKIFITPLVDVIRIRTGERGKAAI